MTLTATALVVIDMMTDPSAAMYLCQTIRKEYSSLPILALISCPRVLAPQQISGFIGAGANSIVDIDAGPDQLLHAIYNSVRGVVTVHLGPDRSRASLLQEMMVLQQTTPVTKAFTHIQTRILKLMVQGLSDGEIGKQLHLSPHTIKHHIERLREMVGAKNRIHLAAWAGSHGFYVAPLASECVAGPENGAAAV